MVALTKAHHELFRRQPDECFSSFEALTEHCDSQRSLGQDLWKRTEEVVLTHDLTFCAVDEGNELVLNDWSFSQLCRMAGVSPRIQTYIQADCSVGEHFGQYSQLHCGNGVSLLNNSKTGCSSSYRP